jgi:hypothetical protein
LLSNNQPGPSRFLLRSVSKLLMKVPSSLLDMTSACTVESSLVYPRIVRSFIQTSRSSLQPPLPEASEEVLEEGKEALEGAGVGHHQDVEVDLSADPLDINLAHLAPLEAGVDNSLRGLLLNSPFQLPSPLLPFNPLFNLPPSLPLNLRLLSRLPPSNHLSNLPLSLPLNHQLQVQNLFPLGQVRSQQILQSRPRTPDQMEPIPGV